MPDDLGRARRPSQRPGRLVPVLRRVHGGQALPLYCHEADVQAGFDAGDRMLRESTDLDPGLYKTDENGTNWGVPPSPAGFPDDCRLVS